MKLSERCARLREDAVNVKSHSIPVTREWLLHFYKGALEAPALPVWPAAHSRIFLTAS